MSSSTLKKMPFSGQTSDTEDIDSELIFCKENFLKAIQEIYPMCVIDASKSNSNEVVLRLPLKTGEEAEEFKSNLSNITSSNWIVYRGHKAFQRVVFSKSWSCQHSKKNKSASGLRNADCGAKLSVLIKKVNRNTKRNDPHLKGNPPLNAEVKLFLKHTHTHLSAAALKLLRVNESVKEKFYEYFSLGMTPTEASRCHETKFLDVGEFENLANASINPTKRQVNHLHELWRLANLGPNINPFDKLKEKMPLYFSSGTTVKLLEEEENWALLIVTEVMERVQMLIAAQEIIFIDSTCSCETTSSTLTILLLATKAGALPIAALIHPSQTSANYISSFQLLKDNFPCCFGGENHPKIFMTDDSPAEKSALKAVWPESVQLLCHFHVAQAEWRWLFASGNKIPHQERPRLMKLFQAVMYANTSEKLEVAISGVLNEERTYPHFITRFNKFFARKEEWLLLHRKELLTRQNNTNNFCEATIRILKDVVLCRTKAFNIVALTEFCISVWNTYLKQKLLDFAYSRRNEVHLLYNQLNKKIKEMAKEDIILESENRFIVRSATDKSLHYTVDIEYGVCTCEAGTSGAFCKHQYYLMHSKNITLPNAPPASANDRYMLAQLALGLKCPVPSFFLGFNENQEKVYPLVEQSHEAHFVESSLENLAEIAVNQTASNEEMAEVLKELQRITDMMSGNVDRKVAISASNILKTIKKPEDFQSLFSLPNLRSKRVKRINVQPTAINRRRQGLTQSKKRVPSGRPPTDIQKRGIKKKRCLAENVEKNQPNAKSHGANH